MTSADDTTLPKGRGTTPQPGRARLHPVGGTERRPGTRHRRPARRWSTLDGRPRERRAASPRMACTACSGRSRAEEYSRNDEARTFALNPPAAMLRKGPASLHDLGLWMTDPFHFRVYAETLHSVTTGQPAVEKVTGMPVFEYFAREPKLSAVFNNAMTSWSVPTVAAALKAYDFSGIQMLVDVAGGHGHVLTAVLRQYPAMRGVLFDLEHVIAGAAPLIDASGVRDRVETVSGDFFKAVPPGGDAYIMKNIIHDWDDDRAIAILKNIWNGVRRPTRRSSHPARSGDSARQSTRLRKAHRHRDAAHAWRPRTHGGRVCRRSSTAPASSWRASCLQNRL